MTKAGYALDHASPSRALPLLGRSVATTAGTLVLVAGLAATAHAASLPSPSESMGPTQSAAPAPPPPSPSSEGNRPPVIDCPGLVTQAGDTDSVRIHALDPDGDTVTLSAGTSWLGGEATVEGHVVTYTAPTDAQGNDGLQVTADDGRGGSSTCEISILVQAGPSPTPTPTSTPTPTPTPTSANPTPTPTDSAPGPSQDPTGGSGTPTQAPTSAPTAGPPQDPTGPVNPAPTSGAPAAPTTTPGLGGDDGTSGDGTGPHGPAPGDAGGSSDAGSGPGAGDSDGHGPDGAASPSDDPVAEVSIAQMLSNIIRDTAIACPVRAVAEAEKLVEGLSAGMMSRPGGGNFPGEEGMGDTAGGSGPDSADNPGSAHPVAAADRTAHTGSTLWLFSGVGLMMVALIALALAALPRSASRD